MLDVSNHSIILTLKRKGNDVDQTFDLSKSGPIATAASNSANLRAGMRVVLKVSRDTKAVIDIKEVKDQQEKDNGSKSKKNVGKNKRGN